MTDPTDDLFPVYLAHRFGLAREFGFPPLPDPQGALIDSYTDRQIGDILGSDSPGVLRRRLTSTPALVAWHKRNAKDPRYLKHRDALWAAACWESDGTEEDGAMAEAVVKARHECTDPRCRHHSADCDRWVQIRKDEKRRGWCRLPWRRP